MKHMTIKLSFLILVLTALSGCSVNPVSGKNKLNFMSENWERETGKALYYQSRQAQGGDFILDASKILGDLELQRGNREIAVRYYQQAARSNSNISKKTVAMGSRMKSAP